MDLMELLKTRRSFRRFDQSRPVPDSVIQKIARAQQYASCSGNSQSLRYIMVSDPALVEEIFALTRWAAKLPPEDGQPKPGEHPTLLAVVMIDKAAQNDWTPMDAGIAMNNMTLAAWEEGVGSCILGNVARVPLAKLLDIPEQMHVYTVVAFGYPTHRSTLREVEPSEDLTYYLDENRDYVVPRKKIEEVIQFR